MVDAAGNTGITDGSTSAGQSGSAGSANPLDQIYSDIEQALTRTKSSDGDGNSGHHSGKGGDRWVSGDVSWDGYDLPTLVSMVASPASPAQVDTVADLWRTNGAAITQGAENLSQSLTTLLTYWQGAAAKQAADTVSNSAGWIAAVGDTAAKVADQVEDAGGALQSAQNTMPGQPTNSYWTAFNTAAGGAAAGSTGGPVGTAAGTMVGSLASVFGANADQDAMKQQAVQTMQRYEQAAVSIDTSTPQFQVPPSWGDSATGSAVGALPAVSSTTTSSVSTFTPTGGTTTTPSFADDPVGRWNSLTGGGAGGSGGSVASGAGFGGGVGGGVGGVGGSGLGGLFGSAGRETAQAGIGARPGGAVSGARQTDDTAAGGRTGTSSVLEDVDGNEGGAMPMGGGMMGGGRGMGGGGDSGHRRRTPFDEDPFLTGLKAAPRVIGLRASDREDSDK